MFLKKTVWSLSLPAPMSNIIQYKNRCYHWFKCQVSLVKESSIIGSSVFQSFFTNQFLSFFLKKFFVLKIEHQNRFVPLLGNGSAKGKLFFYYARRVGEITLNQVSFLIKHRDHSISFCTKWLRLLVKIIRTGQKKN